MNTVQKILKQTDIALGLGLIGIVAMLVLPIPHWALDTGLVIAIASAIIILLSSVNISDPLQFSVFPSLLLITTLFRLALSITATKLILGHGDGGRVIETFGNFVMGGNFVVGFVAFLILVIVQFIVITNGAGRVSEVVARFTLDAMPGKQMAIDADLAAGLINDTQARERRKQIKQESDFYGAMDGASKFVKGDAIASILIIIVNIIGGFIVGYMRGEGDILTIMRTYTLLSVGEGLVSQIPALLISTSSGLLVTRAGQESSMSGTVMLQIFNQPKALLSSGVALVCFAFIPGFPTVTFLVVGGGLIAISQFVLKNPEALQLAQTPAAGSSAAIAEPEKQLTEQEKAEKPTSPEAVLPLLGVDPLEVEIGYGLTQIADARAGGDLSDRITATRRQIALDLGFVMPSVRIRDSLSLRTNEYTIKVKGEEVARGEAMPNNLLAIDSGAVVQTISGTPTREPVFGLDAIWIDTNQQELAERNGYTVIEPSAMISTHLNEVIKKHAAELLSRQDVQTIVDKAKEKSPAVVEELIPNILQIGDVQKVLQHLLQEGIPVKDINTILETLADYGGKIKDHDQLGELARGAISRTITRQYADQDGKLYCITLDPALEKNLTDQIQHTTMGAMLVLDPQEQESVMQQLKSEHESSMSQGYQAVILCGSQLRLALHRLVERYIPGLPALAYNEIATNAEVEFTGQIKLNAA